MRLPVRPPRFLRSFEQTRTFKPDNIDHGALFTREHLKITLGKEAGLHCDAAFVDHRSPLVILFAHGNRYNITWFAAQYALFDALGISYLTFDYPGYGSSPGEPSEEAMYASMRAAYSYLSEVKGYQSEQIVIYGLSLGAAVAAELLQSYPARCFIVECPFVCSWEMARHLFPRLPIWWIFPNRFRNDLRFSDLKLPVFIMHGADDPVTPVSHSQRLFEIAREPKQLTIIPSAHHLNCLALGGEVLETSLRRFIDTKQVD